ncbi:MAG: tyrosine-type recombinase/integrase [Hyphomicrobiales bacterium]|nr:tyrosine-type recombinase/integrase [Hyphomicrobiales bacterium]
MPLTPRNGTGPALTPAAASAAAIDPATVLERWHASLRDSARRKYSLALRTFATWATGTDSHDAALAVLIDAGRAGARGMLCAWRDELLRAGKASATVAGLLSGLSSCVTAARFAVLVEWSIEKVAPRIEQRHDRSGPPRHEVELLLARVDEEAAAGGRRQAWAVRDAAILRLLHNAALRRFEVTGLQLQHVQLDHADGPRVLALRKGHTEREAMLVGPMAAESLRRWLAIRGTTRPDAPVFCRLHALQDADTVGPLSGEAVRQLVAGRARRAGVRAPCRPHGLRHAAATHCARNASLAALKRLGGWTTLSSPARYLDRDDRDRRTALQVVEC